MKKVLMLAGLMLSLSACTTFTPPYGDAVANGVGITVTNNSDGTGIVDVANGGKGIRNVAFTITAPTALTLTKAPDGGQCAYYNDGKTIYCRIGDMSPITSTQAKFKGVATSGKLGYIDADGVTQTRDATLINRP